MRGGRVPDKTPGQRLRLPNLPEALLCWKGGRAEALATGPRKLVEELLLVFFSSYFGFNLFMEK